MMEAEKVIGVIITITTCYFCNFCIITNTAYFFQEQVILSHNQNQRKPKKVKFMCVF